MIATLLAVALSLSSTNDYVWTTGAAPYKVVGVGIGSTCSYSALRGEDAAFLIEMSQERLQTHALLGYDDIAGDITQTLYPFPVPPLARLQRLYYILNTDKTYWNYLMNTNAPCLCSSSGGLLSSKKYIGDFTSTPLRYEITTNVFIGCVAPTIRNAPYVNNTSNLLFRALSLSVITNIYCDYKLNTYITFGDGSTGTVLGKRLHCVGGYYDTTSVENEYANFPRSFSDEGWEYYEDSHSTQIETNTAEYAVLVPMYEVFFSATKRSATGWHDKSAVSNARGTSIISSESWRSAISTATIEFHHSITGRIVSIHPYALYRVSKYVSYPTTTEPPHSYTNYYERSAYVIKPLEDVRDIGIGGNGGQLFSVSLPMPSSAVDVGVFVNIKWPTHEEVSDRLSYPSYPSTVPGYNGYVMTINDSGTSTSRVEIRPVYVFGLAEIEWNAREL